MKIDNVSFSDVLNVTTNEITRILWMAPNNWIIMSSKNLKEELINNFSNTEFAVTDISHSRSILELEGSNVKEVIKKGSPFNIEEMKKNNCSNTTYNGVTVTIDFIEPNLNKFRIISLRSFGESLYHSITDASLEFGYKSI